MALSSEAGNKKPPRTAVEAHNGFLAFFTVVAIRLKSLHVTIV
jgi:hypothetical protein